MHVRDGAISGPNDLLPSTVGVFEGRRGDSAASVVGTRRLRASWQRSRRYKVASDHVQPRFVGQLPTDSLLYECGSEVLRGLAGTVAGEPISMMITDAEGLVLVRLCDDAGIVRQLDRVHLAPGFVYDESAVGTNGLGLALADRAATLVRGAEHYCADLRGYTCAAVPVISPTGDLAGSVNLTTWSDAASDLLLALAQAAAGTTSAMMQLRAGRLATRPIERGEMYRVVGERLPTTGHDPCVSNAWRQAVNDADRALNAGQLLAIVGEPGVGKAAAATFALRSARPGVRPLRAPLSNTDTDAAEWLASWLPELASPSVCLLASGLELMPAWAGDRLASAIAATGRPARVIIATTDLAKLPTSIAEQIGALIEVPPLRHRGEDIMPLAQCFAHRGRRSVEIAADVASTFLSHDWPGNAAELARVVRQAAARTDRITLAHLPPDMFARAAGRLTRLERLERDEIVRILTQPGVTMSNAARALGLSRATLYRKLAHYGLQLPSRC